MTYVSAVPPDPRSIVIAGDRRLTDETGWKEIHKVIQLGNFAVGAITGVPRVVCKTTGQTQFDAYRVMQDILGEYGVDSNMIMSFALQMTEQFSAFQKNNKANFAKPYSEMQVVLFVLDEGCMKNAVIRFNLSNDDKLSMTGLPKLLPCENSRLYGYGDDLVVRELFKGTDPRFNELRARNDIKKFLHQPPPAFGTVSEQEAIAFCGSIINLTNENWHLLSNDPSTVGPVRDIAVIDGNGFRWIEHPPLAGSVEVYKGKKCFRYRIKDSGGKVVAIPPLDAHWNKKEDALQAVEHLKAILNKV